MKSSNMESFARIVRTFLAVSFGLLVAFPAAAPAQVWRVGGTAVVDSECAAIGCAPPDTSTNPPPDVLRQDLLGDLGAMSEARCTNEAVACMTSSSGTVQLQVDGIETPCVRVRWHAVADSRHSCAVAAIYGAGASAELDADLLLTPVGPPAGTPVTVHWSWQQITENKYDDPDGFPDSSHAELGVLTLDGQVLFSGKYDMADSHGKRTGTDSGQLSTTIGSAISLGKNFTLWSDMSLAAEALVPPDDADDEAVSYTGEIQLCLNAPPPPLVLDEWIEFSIDMGSDTSLADVPPFEANEVFDTGDMYLLFDGTHIPLPGSDGLKDDSEMSLLAPDPAPAAPGPPIPDSCSGAPGPFNLDVDGSDTLDEATVEMLRSLLWDGDLPILLREPHVMAPTDCIRRAEWLLISYDDDFPTNVYDPVCEAAAASPSLPLGLTYGSTADQDEVLGLHLTGSPAPYPVASEVMSHVSMAPNPVIGDEPPDDDIDALDATSVACSTWLFSVDTETTFGVPPGDIQAISGITYQPIVSSAHLGLPAGTDLRDFEFVVWGGANYLTLLFTVAPDDPSTPVDESGGLPTTTIHASYLDGDHFWSGWEPGFFASAIDALTALPAPMPEAIPGDLDGDRFVGLLAECAPEDRTTWAVPRDPVLDLSVDASESGIVAWWSTPMRPGGSMLVYDVFRGPITTTGGPIVFDCDGADIDTTFFVDPDLPCKRCSGSA